jgi:hypothetical protein
METLGTGEYLLSDTGTVKYLFMNTSTQKTLDKAPEPKYTTSEDVFGLARGS